MAANFCLALPVDCVNTSALGIPAISSPGGSLATSSARRPSHPCARMFVLCFSDPGAWSTHVCEI